MTQLLMTTDPASGIWTYCMELCTALRSYGVHISLAALTSEINPQQRRQLSALSHVTLYESPYHTRWQQSPLDNMEKTGEWLVALERRLNPEIIHLNHLIYGSLNWRSPVVLVGHSCSLSWWEAVKKRPAPFEQWHRYREVVRHSVRQADRVVAPSTAMLDSLLLHYGPVEHPSVIFNGRDFPPLLSSPEAKVPFMEPLVMSAGRVWDEAKNVSTVAKIARRLPWKVCVAGAQESPEGLRIELPGVIALGHLSEEKLGEWLRRASIYVAPAHYEPFGLGILEAARSGCALVLGDIPSLREIWGDSAEYVDPDDPADLRRCIQNLIANPSWLRELMERAWRRAQRYSSSRMAAGYVHLYQSLRQQFSQNQPLRQPAFQLVPRVQASPTTLSGAQK